MVKTLESRAELESSVDSCEYLFHITNTEGLRKILETGTVKPLTFTGWDTVASFTENPIELSSGSSFIDGKNIVICFHRGRLEERGVRKVDYDLDYTKGDQYSKDKWWVECQDFSPESEWRCNVEVDVSGIIEWIYYMN